MTPAEKADKAVKKARAAIREKKRAARIKAWNEYPAELRNCLRARGEDPTQHNNPIVYR